MSKSAVFQLSSHIASHRSVGTHPLPHISLPLHAGTSTYSTSPFLDLIKDPIGTVGKDCARRRGQEDRVEPCSYSVLRSASDTPVSEV
jgi:hypothetical protein